MPTFNGLISLPWPSMPWSACIVGVIVLVSILAIALAWAAGARRDDE